MSTVIQIKRSSGSTAPTTTDLLEGEMAYAEDAANNGANAVLYIESVDSGAAAVIDAIGGKKFTSTVDALLTKQTSSVSGKVTFSEGTSNGSNKVTLKGPDSLAGDITITLPSTDGNSGDVLVSDGSGNLSFSAPAASSFTISDNQGTPNTDSFATGSTLTFAGTAGIKTTISDNSVGIVVDVNGTTALTSLADADEFLVYDSSATANRKITAEDVADYIYAGLSGDITVTEAGVVSIAANSVALGTDTTGNYVATVAGTTNQITVSGSGSEGGAVTVALADDVVLVGDLTVGGNDIKSSGGTTAITLSSADATVAGDLTVSGNDIKMNGGTTALTFSGSGDVAVAGDLTVTGNDIKSSGGTTALTLSGANVTVAGNLTVSGTTTTVNSTTLTVSDPLIGLATDNTSTDAVDIGLFGVYDTSGSQDLYSGFFRDASDGKWKLFKDSQSAPTTTVNTGATGYTVATLVANIEGGTVSSLSSDIAVADGGTGAGTFTSKGILYGNGTSALAATSAGTAGQVLISGGSGGTPAFGNIDGGTY
jgi:hypothetical protein